MQYEPQDRVLNSLIAGFAVLEQLVINLTHLVSQDYPEAISVRIAMIEDVRLRMETMQRRPSMQTQSLAAMALDHLARMEPRILGQAPETPLN